MRRSLDRAATCMTKRTYIQAGTKLSFALAARERDAIVQRAFLDPKMERRLQRAAVAGPMLVVDLTLDDVEELHGCVAAEANHSDDRKVRRLLSGACDRLGQLLDEFTDEEPVVRMGRKPTGARFTPKQGQYLAFIYYFTKIHGHAPAEAELQKYFKVSAPAVHDMILTLERHSLIDRVPGKARSIRLRVGRAELPELD